jgi:hypothetical protein
MIDGDVALQKTEPGRAVRRSIVRSCLERPGGKKKKQCERGNNIFTPPTSQHERPHDNSQPE